VVSVTVDAALGSSALLPCNVTSGPRKSTVAHLEKEGNAADSVRLVLWFKDTDTRPMYS
jgi:hypothetical protein